MNIRNGTEDDIPFILELERSCPSAAHWGERDYRNAIRSSDHGPERLVLVAEAASGGATAANLRVPGQTQLKRNVLLGFLVARHLAPEWELENIVVAAQARRQGIGAVLLSALVDRARRAKGEHVLLEVRESNTAARGLYVKAGFRQSGRRKMYYSQPVEDAILYSRNVV